MKGSQKFVGVAVIVVFVFLTSMPTYAAQDSELSFFDNVRNWIVKVSKVVSRHHQNPVEEVEKDVLLSAHSSKFTKPIEFNLHAAETSAPPVAATLQWEQTFTASNANLYSLFSPVDLGVTPYNYPPYEPSDPNPEDGATSIDLMVTLTWTGGDPDGDLVKYDIYFGTSSPPPLIAGDYESTSYDLPTLNPSTTYYWQIVAKDYEFSTPGQIWTFTTSSGEPTATPVPTEPPATATPVPPTTTPTPECDTLGMTLEMPEHSFQPGDVVYLKAYACNDTETMMDNVPIFVFLDVGIGEYWFAPTWRHWPPDIDYYIVNLDPGLNEVLPQPLPEFSWPSGGGGGGPYYFWGGMTNQNMTDVVGEIGSWDFTYTG